MTDPTNTAHPLAAWREEIAAELIAARKALIEAEAEHAAASTAFQNNACLYRNAKDALMPNVPAGFARVPLAGANALRLHELKRKADSAEHRKQRAHGARQQIVVQIADLETALVQLDSVLAPAGQEDAA